MCKISSWNSKSFLRKLQKSLGATLFCRTLRHMYSAKSWIAAFLRLVVIRAVGERRPQRYFPHSIIKWIQIWRIFRPQLRWNKFWSFFIWHTVVTLAWWAFQVSQGSVETLFRWGGKRLHHDWSVSCNTDGVDWLHEIHTFYLLFCCTASTRGSLDHRPI